MCHKALGFFSAAPVDVSKNYCLYQQTFGLNSFVVFFFANNKVHGSDVGSMESMEMLSLAYRTVHQYSQNFSVGTQMLEVMHVSKFMLDLQPKCLTFCKIKICLSKQIILTLIIFFFSVKTLVLLHK